MASVDCMIGCGYWVEVNRRAVCEPSRSRLACGLCVKTSGASGPLSFPYVHDYFNTNRNAQALDAQSSENTVTGSQF
jgi:hypothetical protein